MAFVTLPPTSDSVSVTRGKVYFTRGRNFASFPFSLRGKPFAWKLINEPSAIFLLNKDEGELKVRWGLHEFVIIQEWMKRMTFTTLLGDSFPTSHARDGLDFSEKGLPLALRLELGNFLCIRTRNCSYLQPCHKLQFSREKRLTYMLRGKVRRYEPLALTWRWK